MMVVTIVPCARKIEFTVVKDMTFVPFTYAQGTMVTHIFRLSGA